MDLSTIAILTQDGVTSGAIYALLALAFVMVFSITRVIFLAQGEFVAYSALTLAALQEHRVPLSASLLLALGVLTFLVEMGRTLMQPELRLYAWRTGAVYAVKYLLFPLAVFAAVGVLAPMSLPQAAQVALTLLIVIPMGPMIYRLAYEPLVGASTLVLLIVSVGVHFAMVGLGLVMFGAEGWRTEAFSDALFEVPLGAGSLTISGQSLWVVIAAVLLIGALYFYFTHTLSGKALRATAVNRLGAQLVGIGTTQAGRLAFTLAAGLGVLCGVLIGPITTLDYAAGFLIGLKGFVGAIVGGLFSFPVAALGALMVGLLESFTAYSASEYKEVLVFTLILPVLLWRSLASGGHVENEEE
ncbi:MAG: branched-chain amino acid ABC transporter permease [Burkholderiaceae bacterium]|jgi:branched-chain amino acid transport system permease protein|nr:branched-chain amino acid ABC transporter permease [Burkholderiaceae bacterium]